MKFLKPFLGWILLVVASAVPAGLCLLRGWHKEEIALTYAAVVVLAICAWYCRILVFKKAR
jgi:hypothetical protein